MVKVAQVVLVPVSRVARWWANFEDRHGTTTYDVYDGALRGLAADGSSATARLPFDQVYAGSPTPDELVASARPPGVWGVLLVRKGGFAVARLEGTETVESKVGQRHVQGRTKAGGQSQQRFARRRDNQARQAYEAAAEHAARILTPPTTPPTGPRTTGSGTRPPAVPFAGPLESLVTGGDHAAVEAVLEDPRLAALTAVRCSLWLPVQDPRRGVLESAVTDACSVRMSVTNA